MKNKALEELNNSVYKTDGDGNELTVYNCLNRKERRALLKEKRSKKNNR
jgi:agmatine/peptidylarginine deiminase